MVYAQAEEILVGLVHSYALVFAEANQILGYLLSFCHHLSSRLSLPAKVRGQAPFYANVIIEFHLEFSKVKYSASFFEIVVRNI